MASSSKPRNMVIAASTHSSLLSLPRELRDLIYSFVFDPAGHCVYVARDTPNVRPFFSRRHRYFVNDPSGICTLHDGTLPPGTSLQRTCRQLYAETLPILYGQNIFTAELTRIDYGIPSTDPPHTPWPLDLPKSLHLRYITHFDLCSHISLRYGMSCIANTANTANRTQDLNDRFWIWALAQHGTARSLMPLLRTLCFYLRYGDFLCLAKGLMRLGARQYERVRHAQGKGRYAHVASFASSEEWSDYTHSVQHPAFDAFVHTTGSIRKALSADTTALPIPQAIRIGLLDQDTSLARQHELFLFNKFLDELKSAQPQGSDHITDFSFSALEYLRFHFEISCMDLSQEPTSDSVCPYCAQTAFQTLQDGAGHQCDRFWKLRWEPV